jgi:hypothetical protein
LKGGVEFIEKEMETLGFHVERTPILNKIFPGFLSSFYLWPSVFSCQPDSSSPIGKKTQKIRCPSLRMS